ncbi:Cof-type HAD-IIB family hydrolase [Paenibacillus gorillae]|uniref:Cof-type HAD-IIB family hydrolase n=1 Tax=Paenibacillus gorillae TaxID=1243662 RepID=UPI0004B7537D|nr:Cof-type HAD-IIB family hydrolase [Paenibacillus gorillae]
MYKIVFFDVDGTLLSETDRSMHASTKEAIDKLIAKGIKIAIATGRPYQLCEEFKLLDIDYFISANGALINSKDGIIHKSVLSADTVRQVTAFAESHGHGLSYFTEMLGMNGIGADDDRVTKALHETLGVTQYPPSIVIDEVYCLCLYADDEATKKFTVQFPQLRFHRFHGYVVNVLEAAEVSKSVAIRKVLEQLEISETEAIAFGDGGNDIDMLDYVGLGIAMGNGEERLKQHADFVTTKASEGGIAYALKKFGVIS